MTTAVPLAAAFMLRPQRDKYLSTNWLECTGAENTCGPARGHSSSI